MDYGSGIDRYIADRQSGLPEVAAMTHRALQNAHPPYAMAPMLYEQRSLAGERWTQTTMPLHGYSASTTTENLSLNTHSSTSTLDLDRERFERDQILAARSDIFH